MTTSSAKARQLHQDAILERWSALAVSLCSLAALRTAAALHTVVSCTMAAVHRIADQVWPRVMSVVAYLGTRALAEGSAVLMVGMVHMAAPPLRVVAVVVCSGMIPLAEVACTLVVAAACLGMMQLTAAVCWSAMARAALTAKVVPMLGAAMVPWASLWHTTRQPFHTHHCLR